MCFEKTLSSMLYFFFCYVDFYNGFGFCRVWGFKNILGILEEDIIMERRILNFIYSYVKVVLVYVFLYIRSYN